MFRVDYNKGTTLHKNYLYLDTYSTKDQMVVPNYLKGIHKESNPLTLHTNTGVSHMDRMGYLGNTAYWLDKGGITNVILLKTLEKKFHLT